MTIAPYARVRLAGGAIGTGTAMTEGGEIAIIMTCELAVCAHGMIVADPPGGIPLYCADLEKGVSKTPCDGRIREADE